MLRCCTRPINLLLVLWPTVTYFCVLDQHFFSISPPVVHKFCTFSSPPLTISSLSNLHHLLTPFHYLPTPFHQLSTPFLHLLTPFHHPHTPFHHLPTPFHYLPKPFHHLLAPFHHLYTPFHHLPKPSTIFQHHSIAIAHTIPSRVGNSVIFFEVIAHFLCCAESICVPFHTVLNFYIPLYVCCVKSIYSLACFAKSIYCIVL